ncbi:cadherin-like beta sandwich domain-containing protein [Mucilaginibacter sp. HMF5004]|uniref:YDG domain-containing protein n=1 Tax=Mucilaginibacter rivuli TaxID=2857527 RepID=UPI001C5DA4C0|nr:YDG domain-containing protein [Mucilaginibacter rivuli]MBW4891691.1 cadherin-like beta sandwich domain-containing protein [Mucilaginibacter rivuli]
MKKLLLPLILCIAFILPATVWAAAPTVQASNLVFTNLTSTSATLSWTNGNGTARVVFLKATSTTTIQAPAANTTYNPNTAYGSGSQISTSGFYCVYNGAGSSVNITGLASNVTYTAEVIEYNGIAGAETYLTTGAPVANPLVMATNTMLAWDFINQAGTQTSNTPTSVAANLNSAVTISRGSLNVGSVTGSTFNATNFTANGDSTDAVAVNKYLQFTVNASSGYNVNLNSIDVNFRKSATGPSSFIWKYSLDGFATTGVTIGNIFTFSTGVANTGTAQTQIPLSTITALQNVASGKTITFRLYCWGATGTGGTFGFGNVTGNDLAVGGTVTASAAPVNTSTYPKVSNPLSSSLDLTSNLNIPGKTYYVAIPTTGGTAPTTVAQVLAGQDGNNNPAAASGSFVVRYASTDATKTITGLTPSTAYTIYTVSQDQSITPINQSAISSATGTTAAGLSSNADLSSLSVSGGFSLSPTFAAGTTSYTVLTPLNTSSITVTPTVADANATVKVNTVAVTSGAASGNISLSAGANSISVVVTAQDASTKTYTINVTVANAPTAVTAAASSIGTTSATLNGTINDNGASTTVTFETSSVSAATVSSGSGTSAGATTNATVAANTGSVTATYSFTGLTAGTTYYYRVKGINAAGSTADAGLSFTTLPVAPTLTGVAGVNATSFNVDWTAGSGAASYTYDVATDAGFNSIVSGYGSVSTTSTNATITGLTTGTTYYFRVKAVSAGAASSSASVSTSTATLAATNFTANYDFASASGVSPDPTQVPLVDNVTLGSFAITGAAATSAAGRFNANTWTTATSIDLTKYFSVTVTPASNYNLSLTGLSFTVQRSSASGPGQYSVRSDAGGDNFATDLTANSSNGVITTSGGIFTNTNTSSASQSGSSVTLGSNFTNLTGAVTFRIYGFSAGNASSGTFSLDDVKFTGTVVSTATPSISSTGTLSALSTTYGTASASGTFNVSGTNMTAGILVTPPTGFEVSADNTTFASTVTIGAAGTITSTPVYIRLTSTAATTFYSGNVVLSSSGATNANVATVSSTVSGAPITITATNANKTYGTAITGATGSTAYSLSSGTLKNSNTISSVTIAYGTGAAANDAATTYTGQVTPSAAVGANGFLTSNYVITYATGNIIVGQIPLTVTATGPSKAYGTSLTAGASTTNFTVTGTPASGEALTSITLTPDAAGLSATTAATSAYVVTPSAATGTGGFSASNYNITYAPFNGTVSAAALTVTATGPAKSYGTALTAGASTTNFTVTGTPASGEALTSVTLTPDAAGLSATTAATSAYVVTPSAATGTGGFSASNYNITYTPFSGTVSTIPLTVTATGPSKAYGTSLTAGASTTNFTVTGTPASGEALTSVTLTPDAAGLSATTAATSAYVVTPSAATGTGGFSASNYNITYTPFNGTVSAAALTVTATGPSKTYGTALTAGASTTNFTVTGTPASGEALTSVTLTPDAAGLSATTAATSAYVVTPSAATGTGGFSASNYNITYTPFNGTVSAAALTVTATGPSKTYGTALTAGASTTNFTVTGTPASGEALTSVTLTPDAAGLSASTAGGSSYTVTPSAATGTGGFSASNYSITYTTYNGTVSKPNITVSATGPGKTYGTALAAGSSSANFNVSGTLVGSEAINSVTLTPDAAGLSATTSAGSAYVVTPSAATGTGGFSASNYNITYTAYNGTVSKPSITVIATGPAKTYGTALITGVSATNFSVTGTLVGSEAINSVTLTPDAAGLSASTSAGSAYTVAPSAATGTGGFLASNYNITYTAYNGIVATTALTITATGPAKSYGTALSAGTSTTNFSVTGTPASGEAVTGVTLTPDAAGLSAATAVGSSYVVTPSAATGTGGFAASNYNITYAAYNGTVTTRAITVTATGPTKKYGVALTAGPVTTNFSVSGTLASGEVLDGVTLTPNAAGLSATTAAGSTYVVTPSAATGSGGFLASNYNITYLAYNGTVAKTTVLITAANVSKVFGNTLTSGTGFTSFSSAGLAGSETIGSVTVTYGTGAAASDAVGTYTGQVQISAATGGTFSASNYNFSYAYGNIVVTATPTPAITVTGNLSAFTGTFGTASSSDSFNISGTDMTAGITVTPPSGFEVSADNTTFTSTVVIGAAGTISSTPVYVRLSSANNAGNYSGSVVMTSSGASSASTIIPSSTVSKYNLTITASTANKTYGSTLTSGTGSTAYSITSGSLQNSNTISSVTITYGTGAAATAPVATNTATAVPSAAVGANGFSTSNYNITYAGGNIVVGQATLTVTATGTNKTYDGSNTATVTLSDNRVNSDTFTTTYTAAFGDKNVGNGKTVNVTGISISGGASANYTLAGTTASTNANISKASVTVTAQTDTRVYNRATTSSVSPLVGALQGTDVIGTAPVQAFANANVGTGKTITPSGLVITDGNSGGNYNITYTNNTTGVITVATATVTAQTDTRTYDKTTASSVAPVVTGLISGDVVGTAPTQAFSSANVGTGKTITASGLVITDGNSGNNYTISYVNNATGVITVATATVTAQAGTKTYDKTTASAGTPVVTGLATGDVVGTAPTQVYANANVGTGKTLSPSGLVITDGNSGNNYTISYVNSTSGIITVATATVTAQTDTKAYNKTTASSVAPVVTGLVSGDVVGTAPTQAFANANAGTAKTLTPSGLVITDGNSGNNYTISYVNNTTGVITAATATVTAQTDTRTYNRTAASSVSPVVTGLISGDVVGTAPTQAYNNANAGTGKILTPSGLVITDGNSGNNYSISYVNNVTGAITKATATVTAQTDTKAYDRTTASNIAPVVTGLISGDVVGTAPTQTFNTANVGTAKTLTASGLVITDGNSGGNYNISYVANTTGVITSATATVTAQADTKTYNKTTVSSVAPVVTGLLSGDVIATAPVQVFNSVNVGTGKTLTASGLVINDGNSGANYTISYVNSTAGIITTATATVTAQTDTKTYNRTATSAVAPVVTGLISGDVVATAPAQVFNNANVGTGKTLTASGLVINDGNSGSNYSISYVNNTTGVITAAPATVTAQTDTRTYNKLTTSSVSPVVTGLISGDVVATAPTQLFTNANVGTAKTLTPSGLVITDGNGGANYIVSYVNNTTGVITKATATVTAQTATKGYDRTTASATVPVVTGLISGDVVSTAPVQVYNTANSGTGKILTPSGLVINDGNSGGNYNITYVNNTTGVITAATATVTAQAATKAYDKTTASATAPVVTGLLSGDAVATAPVQVYNTLAVGTGKTLTPSGLVINDGNGGANYSISYVNSTAGVITTATATVTAQTSTKVYDKTTASSVLPVVTGLLSGDVIATSPTQVFANANVGTGKTLTPSGLVINDGNSGANYTINYVNSTTGVITTASATVTAQTSTKVYDKTAVSAGIPVVTGLISGDVVGTAPTEVFSNVNAGSGKTLVPSGLVINDGNGGSNYSISYVNNTTGVITAVTATVTAQTSTKVYDKTTASAGIPVVTGLVSGDAIATTPTQIFNSGNVGTGKILTASGLIINDGNSGANYNINYVTNTTGIITAKGVTVTAVADTKAYNNTTASVGVPAVGTLVSGDLIATAPTQTFNSAAVGIGKTLTPAGLVINDGNSGNNYSVSYVPNTTGVITAGVLTYTATPATKVYGAANPTITGTITGFVGGDTQASATTGAMSFATTAVTGSPVGTYAVTGSGLTAANYTFAQASANSTAFTITPATLNIAGTSTGKVYGAVNPALGVTYTGFVNGDSNASLTTQPTAVTTAVTGSVVGTYPITVSGAAGSNYTITYTAGTLTVSPAPLTITAANQTKSQGTVNPALTVTYAGFVSGDTNASLTAQPTVTTTAVTASPVGNYPITATGAASPNYAISYVTGTMTVTLAANPNLASLTLGSGTLSPVFASATTAYTAAVANAVTSITLTPTTIDATTTVKVNGVSVVSGVASGSIPLTVGANAITVVSTAQSGLTATYTVTVTRAPSAIATLANLAISSGTLTPAFAQGTYTYTALVDNTISQIALTPTLTDATATILVNGQPAANAQGITLNLLFGDNIISIFTTAQDGITKLTYTLTIHRATAPSAIAPNNILSPDGDGRNDTWVVKDIQSYPNNKVTIYDRAGRIVYTKNTYTNDWSGTFQGSPLAEGTYYYVVDLGTGDSPIKGFVTIIRRR